jgi:hypothetical protein
MVFPYLKGFDIIKCGFFYCFVDSVFVVIILVDLFRFLTNSEINHIKEGSRRSNNKCSKGRIKEVR